MILHDRRRRYLCPDCGKSVAESLIFAGKHQRHTSRVAIAILDRLKQHTESPRGFGGEWCLKAVRVETHVFIAYPQQTRCNCVQEDERSMAAVSTGCSVQVRLSDNKTAPSERCSWRSSIGVFPFGARAKSGKPARISITKQWFHWLSERIFRRKAVCFHWLRAAFRPSSLPDLPSS